MTITGHTLSFLGVQRLPAGTPAAHKGVQPTLRSDTLLECQLEQGACFLGKYVSLSPLSSPGSYCNHASMQRKAKAGTSVEHFSWF